MKVNPSVREVWALIGEAVRRHGENIVPAGPSGKWSDCFTVEEFGILLWYNVGKDTHIVRIQPTKN